MSSAANEYHDAKATYERMKARLQEAMDRDLQPYIDAKIRAASAFLLELLRPHLTPAFVSMSWRQTLSEYNDETYERYIGMDKESVQINDVDFYSAHDYITRVKGNTGYEPMPGYEDISPLFETLPSVVHGSFDDDDLMDMFGEGTITLYRNAVEVS